MVLPLLGAFSGDDLVQEDAISEQIFQLLRDEVHPRSDRCNTVRLVTSLCKIKREKGPTRQSKGYPEARARAAPSLFRFITTNKVNEPAAPPNFHWTLSWIDNDDHHDNRIDEGDKIYHFLRKSTFVDKMELVKFGVTEALVAAEPAGVEPMLNGVVDTLNMMMPIRQRYLYKYIHGERGDEMFKIEKSLRKTVERVDEKIQLIKDANGFCPPRPKLFDSFPRPKK